MANIAFDGAEFAIETPGGTHSGEQDVASRHVPGSNTNVHDDMGGLPETYSCAVVTASLAAWTAVSSKRGNVGILINHRFSRSAKLKSINHTAAHENGCNKGEAVFILL